MNTKEGIECEGYLCILRDAKTRTVSQPGLSSAEAVAPPFFFFVEFLWELCQNRERCQALPGTAKVSALVASFEHLAGTWSNCPI